MDTSTVINGCTSNGNNSNNNFIIGWVNKSTDGTTRKNRDGADDGGIMIMELKIVEYLVEELIAA